MSPILWFIVAIVGWLVLGFIGRCIIKYTIVQNQHEAWTSNDEVLGIAFSFFGPFFLMAAMITVALVDGNKLGLTV